MYWHWHLLTIPSEDYKAGKDDNYKADRHKDSELWKLWMKYPLVQQRLMWYRLDQKQRNKFTCVRRQWGATHMEPYNSDETCFRVLLGIAVPMTTQQK